MYIGIDLGTSAVKTIMMGDDQSVLAESSVPLTISRPHPLWSEQNPENWWEALQQGIADLKKQISLSEVAGIGFSGQMHGAVLLDEKGEVLRPAILWNDGRSGNECRELEEQVPQLRQITGNLAMPGFTAPKLCWVRKHEPEVFARTRKVLLPKDYLRLKLTGEAISDMSDSAGTLWMDTTARDWSDLILEATGLTREHMPRLVEGSEPGGTLRSQLAQAWGMPKHVMVAGSAGDNAAGAIGVGAVEPGSAFLSLGTSGVYFVVNSRFLPNPDRGAHAFCHCLPETWHQMGVILSASSCLSWLARCMKRTEGSLIEELEEKPFEAGQLLFLPYLSGERTPHNNPSATGAFLGLTHAHDTSDMVQAVLEGVAYAFGDCQQVLLAAGAEIGEVSLIGGGSRSRRWAEILASVLQRPLLRHADSELGPAFGAARLAMLAVTGRSPTEICQRPPVSEVIKPRTEHLEAYQRQFARFQSLYGKLEPEFQGGAAMGG